MKKLEDAPHERNTDITKDLRFHYCTWLMEEGMNRELIFIDESGVTMWTKRTRGRAKRGQAAIRVVAGRRGKNFTMTFAISSVRGLVFHSLQDQTMNAERFNLFLQEASAAVGDNENITLIFDNAAAHRRAGVVELQQGHQVKRLPPYSPFLNCVEQSFSCWKSEAKRLLAETREQLLAQTHQERMATFTQLIEQAVGVVTPGKCVAWFQQTLRYVPQCLQQQDILV